MGIFNFPKQNNERNVRESNLGFFFYIRNVNLLTCIKGHINVLILSECRPGFFGDELSSNMCRKLLWQFMRKQMRL